MKKFFVMFVLAMMAGTVYATGYTRMYLYFKDGTKQEFELTSEVVIRTVEGRYQIKDHGLVYDYDRSTVASIKYGGLTTDIEHVYEDKSAKQYQVNEKELLVSSGADDTMLEVFTTDGRQVVKQHITDTSRRVNLSSLPHGIYVVKMNGRTHKITLK